MFAVSSTSAVCMMFDYVKGHAIDKEIPMTSLWAVSGHMHVY